ncbi:MAG: branched-chain amino acid ABC transporter permease [Candidatus Hecatellales archaeon]|nr:MAG: branched-chain amino acid ABC transporter permease [Candidatus Hecatellales archaeon]
MMKPKILGVIVGLIVVFLLPLWVKNPYYLHILIMMGIWIILVSSLNLIVGYTGQVSLCHTIFYGIGAYTSAILVAKYGWSFWTALPLAGVVAALTSTLIGYPSLRLRGHYLGIATLAFAVIMNMVFCNWKALTYSPTGLPGGPGFVEGVPRPEPAFFKSDFGYYYLTYIITLISLFIIYRLVNSPIGRAFTAIREDEELAEAMGLDVAKYKFLAFTVGCFFAGIAGSLYAHYMITVVPDTFTFLTSMDVLIGVVVGGIGTFTGSILGAIFMVIVPEILAFPFAEAYVAALQIIIYAIVLIVVVNITPRGLAGIVKDVSKILTSSLKKKK